MEFGGLAARDENRLGQARLVFDVESSARSLRSVPLATWKPRTSGSLPFVIELLPAKHTAKETQLLATGASLGGSVFGMVTQRGGVKLSCVVAEFGQLAGQKPGLRHPKAEPATLYSR